MVTLQVKTSLDQEDQHFQENGNFAGENKAEIEPLPGALPRSLFTHFAPCLFWKSLRRSSAFFCSAPRFALVGSVSEMCCAPVCPL